MNQTVNIGDYTFEVHPKQTNWSTNPGIYMFAGWNGSSWFVLYVGRTADFSARPGYHEKWPTAVAMGASRVFALVVHSEQERAALEAYFIKTLQPPLNDRLK